MDRSKLFIIGLILMGLAVTGFDCSSTELTSAKLYIQQKNYKRAIEALHEEVQKNPKSDQGYYLLGYVNGELGNYKEMVSNFDSSLAISKQYEKSIKDSKTYYWAQAFNHGVGFFQKAGKTTNKDTSDMYYDKSAKEFELATEIEPDSIGTYKNLAFVYINQRKYDKAIPPLKKLVTDGHDLDGYKYLGEILYDHAKKFESKYKSSKDVKDSVKAMDYYNQAITTLKDGRKYFPHNADLLLLLSNSYIGAHKIHVALSAFKAGIQEQPNNKYYRYNYGVLLLGDKKYEQAAAQFKKALEIDPTYQNAEYNLAVAYVKWGTEENKIAQEKDEKAPIDKTKYETALPYLEKLVTEKDDDASLWEVLGKVYAILGKDKKAQDAFNKADALRKK